jgi:three-Cys-motif partner protein
MIDEVVKLVPPYGYNVALIDPFAASNLSFSTVAKLASVMRMDLIIHFPLGSMKRNFAHRGPIENFLGLAYKDWGAEVNSGSDVSKLLDVYRRQLEKLGYPKGEVRSPVIKNTNNLPLYHLVFASKSPLGDKIWNDITKRDRRGQGSLPF